MVAPTLNTARVLETARVFSEVYIGDPAAVGDSGKFGWGVDPVAAADRVAFTQTYATAATTVPNATFSAPAVTVGEALGAFTDPPSAAEMGALRTFVNALKTDDAAIVAAQAQLAADVLALKKLHNGMIDALQALGLVK